MKFLLIFLFSFSVNAEDSLKPTMQNDTSKDGFEVLDMNKFKGLNTKEKESKSQVKFHSNCIKKGIQYKTGDAGYEACLREAEMSATLKKDKGTAPSAGFTIGQ